MKLCQRVVVCVDSEQSTNKVVTERVGDGPLQDKRLQFHGRIVGIVSSRTAMELF